jgi:hypothetical protein
VRSASPRPNPVPRPRLVLQDGVALDAHVRGAERHRHVNGLDAPFLPRASVQPYAAVRQPRGACRLQAAQRLEHGGEARTVRAVGVFGGRRMGESKGRGARPARLSGPLLRVGQQEQGAWDRPARHTRQVPCRKDLVGRTASSSHTSRRAPNLTPPPPTIPTRQVPCRKDLVGLHGLQQAGHQADVRLGQRLLADHAFGKGGVEGGVGGGVAGGGGLGRPSKQPARRVGKAAKAGRAGAGAACRGAPQRRPGAAPVCTAPAQPPTAAGACRRPSLARPTGGGRTASNGGRVAPHLCTAPRWRRPHGAPPPVS